MPSLTNYRLPLVTAATLALVMGATSVRAADAIYEEPPAPSAPIETLPVASWTGPYAGITAGYGFGGDADDTTAGNSIGTDGFLGGAFLGYNVELGNGMVAGVEGDVGYSGVKGTNAGTEVKSGVDGSLRARLGYTISPDILLYGTAGGAAKRTSVTEGGIKDSETQLGWTAGAGTDIKFTEQLFGRVEYRYTDYGKDTFTTGSGARDVSSTDHRIQFGVGVHF
jgi:outer membrane immunogenic protein